MKACYTMLHYSPARRDDYISINQGLSPKYPLSFCATRWIEDKPVADRLIELWPRMEKIMDFWMKLPKSKQPSNKSYEVLTTSIKDILMIAKLGFFSYLADMFKPFLTAYQTDNPMVPFMYDDLFRLFKNVLSVIIKPDIMNNCDTASKLNDIDLYKSENHLSSKQIDIGFVASTHIEKLRRRDEVSKGDVSEFRKGVRTCVITIMEKLCVNSPIGSVIVRNAPVFNPEVILKSSDADLIKKVKSLVSHLIKLEWIDAQYGDKVVSQYRLFLQNEAKLHHKTFKSFNRSENHLDEFFFSKCVVHKIYKELSSVITIILALSHGQAAVERSFSLGNSFIVDNTSEKSIRNKKLIKDHMVANNLSPSTNHITKEMYSDYKAAQVKYEIFLKEERNKKEKSQNNNQKVKKLIQ